MVHKPALKSIPCMEFQKCSEEWQLYRNQHITFPSPGLKGAAHIWMLIFLSVYKNNTLIKVSPYQILLELIFLKFHDKLVIKLFKILDTVLNLQTFPHNYLYCIYIACFNEFWWGCIKGYICFVYLTWLSGIVIFCKTF